MWYCTVLRLLKCVLKKKKITKKSQHWIGNGVMHNTYSVGSQGFKQCMCKSKCLANKFKCKSRANTLQLNILTKFEL